MERLIKVCEHDWNRTLESNNGIVFAFYECIHCGTEYERQIGETWSPTKEELGEIKKVKFTFRPNQNTKRCFWYYESEVQIPEVEEKLKKLIKKRGYGESHTNIIKFKSKVRGNEYIILEE